MNSGTKSRAAAATVRVVVITVAFALLAFLVALFLAIVGIVLVSMLRGGGIDLTMAYRLIALPIAIAAGVIALVASIVTEMRSSRQPPKPARHYRRAA